MHKRLILGLVIVAIIGFGIILLINRTVEVDDYNSTENAMMCDAYGPECGVCLGEVSNGHCYVKPFKLSSDQRRYMNVGLFPWNN